MADVVSNIVLQFKADTRQAKRSIKELQGEQKKAAKAALESTERQNENLDAQIAKWGKIAAGVGAAVVAFKGLQAATERYAKISQLELAATGANIDAIQESANGLISRYEALQFASAAMNSDFALTQRQMETVSRFMIVLRNKGKDMGEVFRDVTQAVVEANTEGLKKFGINIEASSGTLEAHTAMMERFNAEVLKAGELSDLAGDASIRAGAAWSDAIDKLVVALGKLGDALAPIVELVADLVGGIMDIGNFIASARIGMPSFTGRSDAERVAMELGVSADASAGVEAFFAEQRQRHQQNFRTALDLAMPLLGDAFSSSFTDWFASTDGKAKTGKAAARFIDEFSMGFTTHARARRRGVTGGDLAGIETAVGRQGLGAPPARGITSLLGAPDLPGDFLQTSPEEIQRRTESLQLQAQAWTVLADAAVSAAAAMIDGSKGIGEAMKDMVAQVVSALGSEMMVKAAREIAEGFAALSNPLTAPTASGHFVAAAKYSAGAALAFGVSGALGGNRGRGRGGGGALPSAAAGAVGGGVAAAAGSSVTIFVGSDFEDNARSNAQRLRRAFERTDRMTGTSTAVVNG